eukprot:comp24353_c0_seq3/m.46602 comp24353_c0_seq3/g.46602  ORF comp24353_c0_seq3/g.46602 comp24353_c0_seq3/m.46602 type:complete len:402 (-) comp24353_c0_seq3:1000-2205(-)
MGDASDASQLPLYQRVRACVDEWERGGASKEVLFWIKYGITPDWKSARPAPFDAGGYLDIGEVSEAEAVVEVERLVSKGALETVPESAKWCVSKSFGLRKPNGNVRLIIDMRPVNEYAVARGIKYETLSDLRALAQPGDHAFSFDLEDGYFALAIQPRFRKYFQIRVGGQLYQYTVLPFGYSLSPYFFMRLMREFARRLRARGIRSLVFLDDWAIFEQGARALDTRGVVEQELKVTGLTKHPNKAHWDPVSALDHLGIHINLEEGYLSPTVASLEKLSGETRSLMAKARKGRRWVEKKQVARWLGLVVSLRAVRHVLTVVRPVYGALRGGNWRSFVRLTGRQLRIIGKTMGIIGRLPRTEIWPEPITATLITDAATCTSHGWGAVLQLGLPTTQVVEAFGR